MGQINNAVPIAASAPSISGLYAVKAADTLRASTTTPTADPDLTLNVTAGAWDIELNGCVRAEASGTTPGFKWQLFTSNTPTNSVKINSYDGNSNNWQTTQVTLNNSPSAGLITANLPFMIKATLTFAATTTVALYWSQVNTSVNNTIVSQGTSLRAFKLG